MEMYFQILEFLYQVLLLYI